MSRILISLIRFYRKFISPLKPSCCRFTPTCSQYAIEAIKVHGSLKGTALAFWRVLRCNPFCHGGYDPIPEKRQKKLKNSTEKDGV